MTASGFRRCRRLRGRTPAESSDNHSPSDGFQLGSDPDHKATTSAKSVNQVNYYTNVYSWVDHMRDIAKLKSDDVHLDPDYKVVIFFAPEMTEWAAVVSEMRK
ncbi:hypothetical protein PENNAL_c0047G06505 [Penicillium nalgiovense]|uniref:Uncharacterized protein n=1 Tax=Penicillium nalgiovense TaxID=60175 RepID=A0A1V6XYG8_PENNA|nr:hypothetical protein PENNAL_c0047G06505 [Penicillium nalgiovense]